MRGLVLSVVSVAVCIASYTIRAEVHEPAPGFISGINPRLALFNKEGECGTGAVVPWAGSLWAVSYAPHAPSGSTDKLYQITPDFKRIVRPESVGGTPANRMIHRETNQLLIGPYVIDAAGRVRTLSPKKIPGRLTGNARHLSDPAGKVYYATMEEGLYEVDLKTLAVNTLVRDGNFTGKNLAVPGWDQAPDSGLPGYHGKGLCSGFGKVFYANNGENSPAARVNPFIPSGALAEWSSSGSDWRMIFRTQFTEITTPDGIFGNEHPKTNPVWALGWDARSVLLTVTTDGASWARYRLPKASHSYDGAHGWNTEWPRIREIGEGDDFLATMHGTFWRFPSTFAPGHAKGIRPHSTYLKVIGDFCRWGQRIVFGCDDSALCEFLNKRKAKGSLKGPGRSQSNFWFVDPARLDTFGPPLGRGAVWLHDTVTAGTVSDPYLFAGYDLAWLWLRAAEPVTVTLECDADGSGAWKAWKTLTVPAGGAGFDLSDAPRAEWIRLVAKTSAHDLSAVFHQAAPDDRPAAPAEIWRGLADAAPSGASRLLVSKWAPEVLRCAAPNGACYELTEDLLFRKNTKPGVAEHLREDTVIPENVVQADAASLVYTDDDGHRRRLPRVAGVPATFGRICREVCTERDLFNAGGTFYELPARNAGGFSRIRPVATHGKAVFDYASWRGLLIVSGVDAATDQAHILRSSDGACAVWAGAADDLWCLGKPRGEGGPWAETSVTAGALSDPYLMNGFDRKELLLKTSVDAAVSLEIDVDGFGNWIQAETFHVKAGAPLKHVFPRAFSGYWARVSCDRACTATAQFIYR